MISNENIKIQSRELNNLRSILQIIHFLNKKNLIEF